MSTMRANAYLDSAGGNTATVNGVTVALASQAQAEAGTDNTTLMTPLRVAQAVPLVTAARSYGAVGSLAYCMTNGQITEGTTYAGSALFPAGIYGATFPSADGGTSTGITRGGSALSGTWRALGRSNVGGGQPGSTLFLRIS